VSSSVFVHPRHLVGRGTLDVVKDEDLRQTTLEDSARVDEPVCLRVLYAVTEIAQAGLEVGRSVGSRRRGRVTGSLFPGVLKDEGRRTPCPTASPSLVAGRAYIDVVTTALRLLTHKSVTVMGAVVSVATWN
jgi:hypothetical protein